MEDIEDRPTIPWDDWCRDGKVIVTWRVAPLAPQGRHPMLSLADRQVTGRESARRRAIRAR